MQGMWRSPMTCGSIRWPALAPEPHLMPGLSLVLEFIMHCGSVSFSHCALYHIWGHCYVTCMICTVCKTIEEGSLGLLGMAFNRLLLRQWSGLKIYFPFSLFLWNWTFKLTLKYAGRNRLSLGYMVQMNMYTRVVEANLFGRHAMP